MRAQLWLVSYGLLGLTQNGLAPILLPLMARSGSAAGLTYAAFALAGLASPALGTWADRTGRHRDLLIWGSLAAGALLLPYDIIPGPLRILLAAGAGLGTMAAMTAGNVLAIQGNPKEEWDDHVARLQGFISGGQVIGLLCAGLLVRSRPGLGFVAAGLALLVAAGVAARFAPGRLPRHQSDKPIATPARGGDAGVSAVHHHGHHFGLRALRSYLGVIEPPLWRFLAIWLIAYPAMNGIATLFPVAMTHQFGMDPIWPSAAYALGVMISLAAYRPVGTATHRQGGGRMLMAGLGLRLALLAGLSALSLMKTEWAAGMVLLAFALTQVVWPLLSVAANSLAVQLAPEARGESVGLFNAATSLASSVGSALAGVIFAQWGFAALSAFACLMVGAALILSGYWLPPRGLARTGSERTR
jgi:MFS family permease